MKSESVEKSKFDCFVDDPDQLREGMELELVIRNLTPGRRKYQSRYVRAIIASSSSSFPDSDTLLVRYKNPSGQIHNKQWFFKVVEELGEYQKI